jgi:hypothetical protein
MTAHSPGLTQQSKKKVAGLKQVLWTQTSLLNGMMGS